MGGEHAPKVVLGEPPVLRRILVINWRELDSGANNAIGGLPLAVTAVAAPTAFARRCR